MNNNKLSEQTMKQDSIDFGAPSNWNKYIGEIWANILLKSKIQKKSTIIEVAPGSVNKIGYGLQLLGFEGILYVVEPNKRALNSIVKQYSLILNKAKIIPLPYKLNKILKHLPKKVDAIISNHPLDDMIIGKTLKSNQFKKLFNDFYGKIPSKTDILWRKLSKKGRTLEKIKKEITNEWANLINKVNPDLVIISQYESYFFKSNGISAPDKNAFEILIKIKARFKEYLDEEIIRKERRIRDSNRWLVLLKDK